MTSQATSSVASRDAAASHKAQGKKLTTKTTSRANPTEAIQKSAKQSSKTTPQHIEEALEGAKRLLTSTEFSIMKAKDGSGDQRDRAEVVRKIKLFTGYYLSQK